MVPHSEIDKANVFLNQIKTFDGELTRKYHKPWELCIPVINPTTDDIDDCVVVPIDGKMQDALDSLFAPVIGLTEITLGWLPDGDLLLMLFRHHYYPKSLAPGVAEALKDALAGEEIGKKLDEVRDAMADWHDEVTWNDAGVVKVARLMNEIVTDHLEMIASTEGLTPAVRNAFDVLYTNLARCCRQVEGSNHT